jgi:hypothetical protein
VVGYQIALSIAGYATSAIAASPAASEVAVGIGNAATWLTGTVSYGAGYLWGMLGNAGTALLGALGLKGAVWTGAAATAHALGIAGAGAATAVAAHAAMPHLHTLQVGADVPVGANALSPDATTSSSFLASQGAHTASLNEVTHAAHHAAESASESHNKNWSPQFANKAAFTSHADAVRATQADKAITPRANFAEQLTSDRANLEAALRP